MNWGYLSRKGMPAVCDTSTCTVPSSLQPRTCRCCLGFRGGPRLLLCPSPARAGAGGCLASCAGCAPPRLLRLARLQGLPEVHSSSKNTALIRQQLCKMFLSSSALKLIYLFHRCQNMSDITSMIS